MEAYIAAINAHDWRRVWLLGGKNIAMQHHKTYASWLAGYSQTSHDVVTSLTTRGDSVYVQIRAYETNGVAQTYVGSYTVAHGIITYGHLALAGNLESRHRLSRMSVCRVRRRRAAPASALPCAGGCAVRRGLRLVAARCRALPGPIGTGGGARQRAAGHSQPVTHVLDAGGARRPRAAPRQVTPRSAICDRAPRVQIARLPRRAPPSYLIPLPSDKSCLYLPPFCFI